MTEAVVFTSPEAGCVPIANGSGVAGHGTTPERNFVVCVLASKSDERTSTYGYRMGFVVAASSDEAIGKWMRYAEAANPGFTISTPSLLEIAEVNLEAAKARHGSGNLTPSTAGISDPSSEIDHENNLPPCKGDTL